MRLEQLVYIKEIEQQQSISKAARALYISQPSLSVALSNLEQEINAPIFIRGKQGMLPTLMGQIVLEKAAVILQLVEELKAINKLSQYEMKGKMKILMPFFASSDTSYYLITRFREMYPQLALELKESDVYQSIQELEQDHADAAIVDFWSDDGRVRKAAEEKQLTYRLIAEDELCLFVSNQHPLIRKKCITLKDLSDYPINTNRRRLDEYFDSDVIKNLRSGVVFNDGEHLKKELIEHNHSIAIMSKRAMADDIYIQTGSIIALDLEEKLQRKINIAFLIGKREQWAPMESVVYQALYQCMQDYFSQPNWVGGY